MTLPAVYFSHGQESGPWGTKIRAMADTVRALGCRAESVDYRGIADPAERVVKLVTACEGLDEPLVLVGSSMGGYVAAAAAPRLHPAGLFVLAPAFHLEEYGVDTPPLPQVPLEIVHGWRDAVVPVEHSIRFAREARATLHLVDGDHRLTDNIDEINYYLARFVRRVAGRMLERNGPVDEAIEDAEERAKDPPAEG
ncbi:MAG TPA: alpha/beta fold hydrolase [Woeseiaceae bacterium]|nr:alpha/beta fold hydrolase [Woeseiaceae bacterium]